MPDFGKTTDMSGCRKLQIYAIALVFLKIQFKLSYFSKMNVTFSEAKKRLRIFYRQLYIHKLQLKRPVCIK